MADDFGARMKGYERAFRTTLPLRMPVILRVDGRAFHTLTARCTRPFDVGVSSAMDHTALALCEEIQGAVFAYVQSDEISVLIHNYKRLNSGAWFGNEVQKMVSVSASIATRAFNVAAPEHLRRATFDSRVFVLPEAEVSARQHLDFRMVRPPAPLPKGAGLFRYEHPNPERRMRHPRSRCRCPPGHRSHQRRGARAPPRDRRLRAVRRERCRSRAARSRELRRRARGGLVRPCGCTRTRRCEAHAAAHVDAYEARRAARSVEQADREDRATARAAFDLRALLDSLPIPA